MGPAGPSGDVAGPYAITRVAANYEVLTTDQAVEVDASAAHRTITLKAASEYSDGNQVTLILQGGRGMTVTSASAISGVTSHKFKRPGHVAKFIVTNGAWRLENPDPGYVTAADWGAYGDGTHDDTAALQAMIDDVAPWLAEKPVMFLEGSVGKTFKCTDTLTVPTDSVDLASSAGWIFDGRGRRLAGLGTNAELIFYCGVNVSGSSFTVSDVTDGVATLTGLSGMSPSFVGQWITQPEVRSGVVEQDGNPLTPLGLSVQITQYISATSVKVAWDTTTGAKGKWFFSNKVGLLHYGRESVLKGVTIRPAPNYVGGYNALHAAISHTEGHERGTGQVVTGNHFEQVSLVTDGYEGAFMLHGIISGDYYAQSGKPGATYCQNNDVHEYRNVTIQGACRASFWCPNDTGQTKLIHFINSFFYGSPTLIDFRYGGFEITNGAYSNADLWIICSNYMDQFTVSGAQSEQVVQYVYCYGNSQTGVPIRFRESRLDPGKVTGKAFDITNSLPLVLDTCIFTGHNADFRIANALSNAFSTDASIYPRVVALGCIFPGPDVLEAVAASGFVLTQLGCSYFDEEGAQVNMTDRRSEPVGCSYQLPGLSYASPKRTIVTDPAYSVIATDQHIKADTSDGEVVITLPSLGSEHERSPLVVKNAPDGIARALILGGTETIDGATSLELPAGAVCELLWDGSEYEITRVPAEMVSVTEVSPTDATGVIAWYEGDSVTDAGGGRLSSINDKKNSFDLLQATGGNQALLVASMQNSLPGIRLVGSRPDFYECDGFDSLAGQDKLWIFAVLQNTNYGQNCLIAEITNDAGDGYQAHAIDGFFAAGDLVVVHDAAQSAYTRTDPNFDARTKLSAFRSVLFTLDRSLASGAEGKIWMNGQLQKVLRTGNASGNFDNGRLRIGDFHDGQYHTTQDLLCLAIGSGALPDADARGMHKYAADKWALSI